MLESCKFNKPNNAHCGMVYYLITQLFSARNVFSFFFPLNNSFSGFSVLYLEEKKKKSLLFNCRMGKLRVAECFLESETGKCLPGCSGIMWHNFQAGKHVHFLVLAFMWGGGVVSIFHICHLRGSRAIILVQTGIRAETSLFFSSFRK